MAIAHILHPSQNSYNHPNTIFQIPEFWLNSPNKKSLFGQDLKK